VCVHLHSDSKCASCLSVFSIDGLAINDVMAGMTGLGMVWMMLTGMGMVVAGMGRLRAQTVGTACLSGMVCPLFTVPGNWYNGVRGVLSMGLGVTGGGC
jgi:hypothetical protein